MTDTFCVLPWIHLYANPDGNVLPCCIGDYRLPLGNVQQNTLGEVWNSDNFKTMRINMLQGKQCNQCTACYATEEAGGKSFRNHVNEQYKDYIPLKDTTNIDGSLDDMTLRYLDVRWSNICNLKCRSCSGTFSSSWAKEDGRDNIYIFAGGKDNDTLYEQFEKHFDTIEEFYFAGGEPLLMDKHYQILNYLIETGRTNVKLRYNTNLTTLKFKQTSIIDLWKKFSNVHVSISLDHYGNRAEYIREGTNWELLEKNIKLTKQECPNIHIGVASVISVFNVYTLPEFIDYLIQEQIINETTYTSLYPIINPEFYSFDILDDKFKKKVLDKLYKTNYSKQIDSQIKTVIGHIEKSSYNNDLRIKFRKQTKHYDSIRNKEFITVFPELAELYYK